MEARTEFSNSKRYPVLYTANEMVLPDANVREYLTTSERTKLIIAEAYVVKSSAQKLISRAYLQLYGPEIPTKIFTNKQKAIEWLKRFLS